MNKIATVVGFFEETKGPQIQFDGEENPAEKEYPYLLSYTPNVDDKVFCLEFGESYIIIGKVNYQEEPFSLDATLEEAIKPTKDGLANLKETHKKFEKTYSDDKKELSEKISTLDTNVTSAVNAANDAKSTAESAVSKANSAQSSASSAKSAADTAKTAAASAQTIAADAKSAANSAVSTANDASRKAQNAESAATSAMTAAKNAKSAADNAYDRNSFSRFSASGPIGFFGTSGASKRRVSTTNSTDANTLKNKINEVINALSSYGLL